MLLVVLWLLGAAPIPAAAAQPVQVPDRVLAAVDDWLQARGLAGALEPQKLRWAPRPDDPSARWLRLELRFLTESTDQAVENERFARLLQDFQRSNTASLAETLFFKLVHVADIPRDEARVTVTVLEDTFAVTRDGPEGRLRFEPTSGRQMRLEVALPGLGAPASPQQPQASVSGAVQAGTLTGRVQRYLQNFFTRRNSEARLPPPQLSLKPQTSSYVGLDVAGIRGVVVTGARYWEFLQISIEVHETPQGRRAVCYLDGGYAPGVGSRVPARDGYTDLANRHQADLERFANELMRGLQDDLARP